MFGVYKINLSHRKEQNCIHLASQFATKEFIQTLFAAVEKREGLAKLDQLLASKDSNCDTPLLLAAGANNVGATELLVDRMGINTKTGDDLGFSGLAPIHAAARGGAVDVAKMLLKVKIELPHISLVHLADFHFYLRRRRRQ